MRLLALASRFHACINARTYVHRRWASKINHVGFPKPASHAEYADERGIQTSKRCLAVTAGQAKVPIERDEKADGPLQRRALAVPVPQTLEEGPARALSTEV